jgi:hypothetical protein
MYISNMNLHCVINSAVHWNVIDVIGLIVLCNQSTNYFTAPINKMLVINFNITSIENWTRFSPI